MEPIQGNVSIDAQNIMPVIKKWLYSDKDIFIREVVSNGCDAITKLRMVDYKLAEGCSIRVEVDKAAKELRFIDDGVGMTEEEVKTNINQVAFSGAKSFLEEYAKTEGKDGEEKCVGETIMVLYDTKKGEKVNFTPEWRAMIEDFEKRKL